jgi:Cu2+-containing amine oxidase
LGFVDDKNLSSLNFSPHKYPCDDLEQAARRAWIVNGSDKSTMVNFPAAKRLECRSVPTRIVERGSLNAQRQQIPEDIHVIVRKVHPIMCRYVPQHKHRAAALSVQMTHVSDGLIVYDSLPTK